MVGRQARHPECGSVGRRDRRLARAMGRLVMVPSPESSLFAFHDMTAGRQFLPYGRQLVEDDDVAAVAAVLRGDYLTTGPAVRNFEAALAAATGAGHAVACSSGTAGLHLAAMALDIGPGDGVVVPAVTFLATANVVRHVGAEVIFADVDAETGLMGPAELAAAMERAGELDIKAVVPVHLAGQCADPEGIWMMAVDRGFHVVDDACHALGTRYGGAAVPVGSCRHGTMATFSFHPVKTITMGEGGAVTTNDQAMAERMRRLRSHGMVRDAAMFENTDLAFDAGGAANPWYYEMPEAGLNYRASDIHCALGLSQLRKLDRFVARRRALADRYDALLAPLAPVVRPRKRPSACRPAWHLYVVLIDFAAAGTTRAEVMNRLRNDGIGTQVHYLPVHHQPYYRRRYGHQNLPGSEAYYERCLALPLFPGMEDGDVDGVVSALTEILTGKPSVGASTQQRAT